MSTGFTFGAKPQQTPAFGTQTTPAFGTQQTPGFGAQQGSTFGSQPTGSITFGTPLSTQTTTTPQFGLGAPTQNQAQFGLGTATQNQPQFGTTPGTGLFGATSSAAAPMLNFGAAAPTPSYNLKLSTAPSFGTSTVNTAAGLTYSTSTSSGGGSLTIGTPAPAGGLSFSTPASTSGGLAFAPPASTGGLSFGTPASSSGGLTFGTPAGGGLSLGLPPSTSIGLGTTTPASTGLSFGVSSSGGTAPTLGSSFGTGTTSALPTLNFGSSASTAPTTALNFGLTSTSAGLGSLGSSFLKPTTTSAITIPQQNVGLGGIITTQPKHTTASGQPEISPKNQFLPNEIQQTVENFKKFVTEQKSCSSDISRCSVKEFKKVEADIDAINNLLNDVESQLQKNLAVTEKLKYDTAKGLQNVEMAHRTHETPPGLQYDNNAPLAFFTELADYYEREMYSLKVNMENTEKYIKNMGEPVSLTSQDLSNGMRRLHETFVVLAGRLHSVHNQVETQKEQYLNLRKHFLNDDTNVFEKSGVASEVFNIALNNAVYQSPKIATGPSPFMNNSHASFMANATQNPPPPYPGTSNLGLSQTVPPFGTNPTATTKSLFGNNTSFGQSGFQLSTPSTTSFQLQKPPVGNKRGKQ